MPAAWLYCQWCVLPFHTHRKNYSQQPHTHTQKAYTLCMNVLWPYNNFVGQTANLMTCGDLLSDES